MHLFRGMKILYQSMKFYDKFFSRRECKIDYKVLFSIISAVPTILLTCTSPVLFFFHSRNRAKFFSEVIKFGSRCSVYVWFFSIKKRDVSTFWPNFTIFWLIDRTLVCFNFLNQISVLFDFLDQILVCFDFLDQTKKCSTLFIPVQICFDFFGQNSICFGFATFSTNNFF